MRVFMNNAFGARLVCILAQYRGPTRPSRMKVSEDDKSPASSNFQHSRPPEPGDASDTVVYSEHPLRWRMKKLWVALNKPAYLVPDKSVTLDLQKVFRRGDPETAGHERAARKHTYQISGSVGDIGG